MKTKKDIQQKLTEQTESLKEKKKEYDSLGQIGAMDTPGQKLSTEIKKLEGSIETLNWILS